MSSDPGAAAAALAARIEQALEDGKAVDVRVLDVADQTVITDYMIVASGRSPRQVKALVERVREAAAAAGQKVLGTEGDQVAEWVLVDLGDVLVHVMQPACREFYQLEKLWEDQPRSTAGHAPVPA